MRLFSILRPPLFHFAQWCDRKTPFLNLIKRKLHLKTVVTRIIAPPASQAELDDIRKHLRTNVIAQKVEHVLAQNLCPEFYILSMEGIGDVASLEPVAPYLKSTWTNCKVYWIVREDFRALVEGNPAIDGIITFPTLADGYAFTKEAEQSPQNIVVNCHLDGSCCFKTHSPIRNPNNPRIDYSSFLAFGSLQQIFCLAAGLPPLDEVPHFHFEHDRKLPAGIRKRYVAIHCRSSGPEKDWSKDNWEKLVDYLTGKGLQVVEVGMPHTVDSTSPLYYNFAGKKDIRDVAWIIHNATLFIGIDSGFSHIANALQVPSLVMIGKYAHFLDYNPFSGDFSRSKFFKLLRAPRGCFTKSLPYDSVVNAFNELYSLLPSKAMDEGTAK